jgi:hypothetical protein
MMKHLKDRGLLDGTKQKRLNIVMDNSSGQNKNNIVLRLSPHLQEKGFFLQINFTFLVVGHTKNIADRLFNALKKLHRLKNLFSMGMLVECFKHELVIPCQVDWRVFMDWDKCLTRFCKKMSSALKWQMFQSSTEIFFKSSNVENANTWEESAQKPSAGADQQNGILMEEPMPQCPQRPGLREIKHVEMFKKCLGLVPAEHRAELCPKPATLKPAPSPPSTVAAAATSGSSCKNDDERQELTIHGPTTSDAATVPSSPLKRSHVVADLEEQHS